MNNLPSVRFSALVLCTLLYAKHSVAYESPLYDSSIVHKPSSSVGGNIKAYGAGGPHPSLIKAADAFEKKTGKKVEIIYGPESKWTKDAQKDADIIFSPSEQSMTAFLENYKFINQEDVKPIYIRPAVIAVKPGNPKKISGIESLIDGNYNIIVTEGKGTYNTSGTGLWEDVVGRLGKVSDIAKFKRNIIAYEQGSGSGFKAFQEKGDAWITWIDWPLSNKEKASFVEIEENRRIYRVLSIAVSKGADKNAQMFADFLLEPEAKMFFNEYGWYNH